MGPGISCCLCCGHRQTQTKRDNDTKFGVLLTELKHLLQESGNSIVSPDNHYAQSPDSMTSDSEEINRLDDLIRQLQTRRAILLRRTNHQRSPICKLPTELLAEIFQYADAMDRPSGCSLSKRRHPLTPIRLGAVCSHWRQVAWSSPQLWTQMPLTGCWAWQQHFPIATIFRTYFRNMKARPLELIVDCFRGGPLDSDDERSDVIPHEDAFKTIFVENGHRLKTLRFKTWPRPWLSHIAKVQQAVTFSNLEEVWMKSSFDTLDGTFSITNAPRLRTVELTGISGSAVVDLPWNVITHLTLTHISSNLCLKLFVQCPNLEYFSCKDLHTSPTSDSLAIKDSIALERLKDLHYLDHDLTRPWKDAMGRYLSFPSLETITWRPHWSANIDWQLLCLYPNSIQNLDFRLRRRDKRRLKSMLLPLISLSNLKISCWPSLKTSLLELLTPQPNRALQMLPSLRKLHLTAKTNQMTTCTVQTFLEMIRLRRTATKETLDHLILSFDYLKPWPRDFIEGMREFVGDGMKVVVEEDEVEIECDWQRHDLLDDLSEF